MEWNVLPSPVVDENRHHAESRVSDPGSLGLNNRDLLPVHRPGPY
jgi:hypothetical protein